MTVRIDISAYQHPGGAGINYGKVKAAGISGVIIKASQGDYYSNPYFARDATAAAAAGLEVDAYHFYDPQIPAAVQARFFRNCVGAQSIAYIADDAEIGGGDQTDLHLDFMATAEQLFGLPAERDLFYSYDSWIPAHLRVDARLALRQLWEAAYGSVPHVHAPWTTIALHQDRSNLRVPGIVGDVDEDLGALALLIAGAVSTQGVRLAQPVCGGAAMPGGPAEAALFVARDGGVFPVGGAPGLGSLGGLHLNAPAVALAPSPDGRGYWVVAADGGVWPFGDAVGYGSIPGEQRAGRIAGLVRAVVGIAASAAGYWLVAADGGVFPFGDAAGQGSLGGQHLNADVVAIVGTPSRQGYWLVAADGGVFPFGDAAGYGSLGSSHLNAPIVAMACTPSGKGYWLAAADGGVFPFGDAPGEGSIPGLQARGAVGPLVAPVVGMGASPSGGGYWLICGDGGVFNFGDARVPRL